MTIAITEEHLQLAETVRDFLQANTSRAAARALLVAESEELPAFWDEACALGWLGLHIPEDLGGSGYGLEELVVVAEALGRELAPGPFVPTAIVAGVLARAGGSLAADIVPGLAEGTTRGALALHADVEARDGRLSGSVTAALGIGCADVLLLPVGEDAALVRCDDPAVSITIPRNLDPSRRSGTVALNDVDAHVIVGGAAALRDLARSVLAAEATGVARECTEQAAEYAKVREQFGRPIATFQAVKHHCANMLVETELATALVWDASRAAGGGDQFSLAAALAAGAAGPAAYRCANLNIQVHGGIGFTWEHDAHLYLRRATAIQTLLDVRSAALDAVELTRAGVRRERNVDLPPEAEAIRENVRSFAAELADLDDAGQRHRLIESGYVMPHWPKPWGREAGAVEQLVIEQEFTEAGVSRPNYGITGWVILTLIQHATEDQVQRWVPTALTQEVIWCQLFSEPDAGSDAAGVKTKATRVDGGWLVNGQKVWTSGAHVAKRGLATVRTDPEAPKHNGITTMVIDMEADGVEVRPLRMPTGGAEFNEVFFSDVFVPDDDVVGPVDGGWTVARATLGNESVSIGSGGGMSMPGEAMIPGFDANPDRLSGGPERIGRYIAVQQAMTVLNLRRAHRAVAGGGPGPEGNVTKLVLSELGHESAEILNELAGDDGLYLEGDGGMAGTMVLMHRAMSIAGGTSEIKRNQIGERILGLPRDPLIK